MTPTMTDLLAAKDDAATLFTHALRLLGALEYATMTAPKKPRTPKAPKPPRDTWMTPFAVAWDAEMGAGSFPFGVATKPLKALVDAGHPSEEIAARLGYYVREQRRAGKTEFLSIPRFAATYADHDPGAPAFPDD